LADLQGNTATITGALTAASVTVTGTSSASRSVLPYGTTIATDASQSNYFSITVTDGVAFTISAPLNVNTGRTITYTIKNTSGTAALSVLVAAICLTLH